jgi:hypothetical protein
MVPPVVTATIPDESKKPVGGGGARVWLRRSLFTTPCRRLQIAAALREWAAVCLQYSKPMSTRCGDVASPTGRVTNNPGLSSLTSSRRTASPVGRNEKVRRAASPAHLMTLFEPESARIVTLGHSGRVEESKSHKAHFVVTSATPAGATLTRHRIVVWVGLLFVN